MSTREAGFTMVETVVGLVILLTVLGIFSLFLLPLMVQAPLLSQNLRSTLDAENLQALAIRIGDEVAVPDWWPQSAIVVGEDTFRIRDLGYLHTAKEAERPDLLWLQTGPVGTDIVWRGLKYHFSLPGKNRIRAIYNLQKQLVAVRIELLAFASPLIIQIPIRHAEPEHVKK